jgi:hypothetical protein
MFGMTPAQKIWHTITKSLLQRVLCTSWDICYSSRDVNLMLQFNKNLFLAIYWLFIESCSEYIFYAISEITLPS